MRSSYLFLRELSIMSHPVGQKILVTGATGDIGRRLVAQLSRDGHPVVAMCRKPEQIADFEQHGIEAVFGDLGKPATLAKALQGCDRMFLLTVAGRAQQEHGRHGVEAAQAAGIRHVVHLSTGDANPNSPIPWANAPAHTDVVLKQRSGSWTILRPSAFMQNLVQSAAPIKKGVFPQTAGRGVLAWIDTEDIARVAATVLTSEGHESKEYYLTGPELLTMSDIASHLTAVLNYPVRHLHLPGPLFFLALRAGGLDSWTARGLVHQFIDVVRKGHDFGDLITDTVHVLTGTPARSVREYLADNRAAFAR